ncbi:MAG: hypothetical protein QF712_05005 [Candidatus Marinimicrobia bacterium]|jgi:ribosomal protein L31|nr:hypothetical protein [Candidatus Neomarinimicrobiota bacterium]|tara:strand:- start:125 stop:307 length:183 start_codon:yes stop_codon:yes gene_type:complete
MKKHILPTYKSGLFNCRNRYTTLSTLEKGGVTGDGWMTLVGMIGFNLIHIIYWIEYFSID